MGDSHAGAVVPSPKRGKTGTAGNSAPRRAFRCFGEMEKPAVRVKEEDEVVADAEVRNRGVFRHARNALKKRKGGNGVLNGVQKEERAVPEDEVGATRQVENLRVRVEGNGGGVLQRDRADDRQAGQVGRCQNTRGGQEIENVACR